VLFNQGCRTYVLDGDNVRHGLNGNLGFSVEDRAENCGAGRGRQAVRRGRA